MKTEVLFIITGLIVRFWLICRLVIVLVIPVTVLITLLAVRLALRLWLLRLALLLGLRLAFTLAFGFGVALFLSLLVLITRTFLVLVEAGEAVLANNVAKLLFFGLSRTFKRIETFRLNALLVESNHLCNFVRS